MRKTAAVLGAVCLVLSLRGASCGTAKKGTSRPESTPSTSPTAIRPAQNSTGLPLTVPDGFSMSCFARVVPDPTAPPASSMTPAHV